MAHQFTAQAELRQRQKSSAVKLELPLDPVFIIGHFTKLSNWGQQPTPQELLHSVNLKAVSEMVTCRLTFTICDQSGSGRILPPPPSGKLTKWMKKSDTPPQMYEQ